VIRPATAACTSCDEGQACAFKTGLYRVLEAPAYAQPRRVRKNWDAGNKLRHFRLALHPSADSRRLAHTAAVALQHGGSSAAQAPVSALGILAHLFYTVRAIARL
jgi:hypothetical protein